MFKVDGRLKSMLLRNFIETNEEKPLVIVSNVVPGLATSKNPTVTFYTRNAQVK
jgi:hypothetical protein